MSEVCQIVEIIYEFQWQRFVKLLKLIDMIYAENIFDYIEILCRDI